ncbi:MAG: ACP S-malonyltransferase [Candidatus Aminicenantes bacterium]|nr:ACP S-malonyltransferase [Candidatus Aminicenantes bacterium]
MMTRWAFLFPGQGSQAVGMGRSFWENYSVAKEFFERADSILGYPLSRLCFEGPEEELKLTRNTQPALLTVSTIAYALLDLKPALAAGHSLGEYSALVAAGSLNFEDAVRLVHGRGRYMQEAVPVGQGAMAAVLGVDGPAVLHALGQVKSGTVEVANWNSPEQVVIAGHKESVDEALKIMKAPRSILLPVSAPFHSSLMKSAEERLGPDLDRTEFRDPMFPIVTNVEAEVIRTGSEAREALKRQVSRPVLWLQTMEVMRAQGFSQFLELGAGKVLSGLAKRIGRTWPQPASCRNIEDAESLEKARLIISGTG